MERVESALLQNIHEEREAIRDYTRDARTARKSGNKPASRMFLSIAKDEREHLTRNIKMLRRVEKAEGNKS